MSRRICSYILPPGNRSLSVLSFLSRGIAMILLAGVFSLDEAGAHSVKSAVVQQNQPVRIVRVYGKTRLEVGEAENYRVRVNDRATRPIVFRWSMGDGTLSEGNNVVHRYERPGRYLVVVTARNNRGIDTDSVYVTVTAPRPPSTPPPERETGITTAETVEQNTPGTPAPRAPTIETALRSSSGIDWPRGGLTLMAATHFDRANAEAHALSLRRAGYRTGILVDEKRGASTVYRVIVGQFTSEPAAVTGRQRMLDTNQRGTWLVMPLETRSGSGD